MPLSDHEAEIEYISTRTPAEIRVLVGGIYQEQEKLRERLRLKGKTSMHFAIVNESDDPAITSVIVAAIAAACERQLFEHFAPFWERSGFNVKVYDRIEDVPDDGIIVAILNNSDQAGALGYHATTRTGRPYVKVFWKPIKDSGGTLTQGANSLSVTVSHECLETAGDPYATWWAEGPGNLLYALELCDACEAESYDIDGIAVSNFVGPRFFRQGPGPYDFMTQAFGTGGVTKPFQTTKGGYQIVAKDMRHVHEVFGAADYPEWKKENKKHVAARASKRKAEGLQRTTMEER